jgi:cell division protein FtsL
MNEHGFGAVDALSRPIDNSRLVRQMDPHSNRRLWSLLLLIGALVSGAVLYAWPQIEAFKTGLETAELHRDRERLIELNRKMRLEKAALEDLERIEALATRDLGFVAPSAESVVIVEFPRSARENQMASELVSTRAVRN